MAIRVMMRHWRTMMPRVRPLRRIVRMRGHDYIKSKILESLGGLFN
jgi:hypothetical protein